MGNREKTLRFNFHRNCNETQGQVFSSDEFKYEFLFQIINIYRGIQESLKAECLQHLQNTVEDISCLGFHFSQ